MRHAGHGGRRVKPKRVANEGPGQPSASAVSNQVHLPERRMAWSRGMLSSMKWLHTTVHKELETGPHLFAATLAPRSLHGCAYPVQVPPAVHTVYFVVTECPPSSRCPTSQIFSWLDAQASQTKVIAESKSTSAVN